MLEFIVLYTKYLAMFLLVLVIVKYISYAISIGNLHRTLKSFACSHGGIFHKGSLFTPPLVTINDVESSETTVIRMFFLYKGRRGNYSECTLKLSVRDHLTSFTVTGENVNYRDMTLEPEWKWSVTGPEPVDYTKYDSLKELLLETASKLHPDLIQCWHNGSDISLRILQLIETPDELDFFYNTSKKVHSLAQKVSLNDHSFS